MADYAIRKCGGGWMYCTGECKKCIDSRILATGGTSGTTQKHGYWHDVYLLSQETQSMVCSICGVKHIVAPCNFYNYCPYCGAKMDIK